MPSDETTSPESSQSVQPTSKSTKDTFFSVPAPIKRLFSYFPLLTYPANTLPARSPIARNRNALYIFTTAKGAEIGAPSFNPGCLKWQTYLKISGVEFYTIASNNHASPSGALPFLLPSSNSTSTDPIVVSRLQKWVNGLGQATHESSDMRYEAYMALIDHRVRRAWLYSLYLTANFDAVAVPLYILPATSSSMVQVALARELRAAAESELLRLGQVIDAKALIREADEAFAALETLLGRNDWFFGNKEPGLFDAAVFAYTHLLLDEGLGQGWKDNTLSLTVSSREKLVSHRERLLDMYF